MKISLLFPRNPQKHVAYRKIVLTACKEDDVTLKLRRYAFFTTYIGFLSHIIRPGPLKVSNHTDDYIHGLELHTAVTELYLSLGLYIVCS